MLQLLAGPKSKPSVRPRASKVRSFLHLIVAHDLLAAAASFPIAVLLRVFGDPVKMAAISPMLLYGTPLFILLSMIAFKLFGVHRALWRYAASTSGFLPIFKAVTCAVLLFSATLPLLDQGIDAPRAVPHAVPFIQWFVLMSFLCGSRLAYASVIVPSRRRRAAIRQTEWEPIIIAGTNSTAAILIQLLHWPSRSRFEVVGLLDDRRHAEGRSIHNVPVLGALGDLPQVIARLSVHGVTPRRLVLSRSLDAYDQASLEQCRAAAVQFGIPVQQADEFIPLAMRMIADQGQVRPDEAAAEGWTFPGIKRIIDVALVLVLLVAVMPLMLVAALLVWGSLGRPVIFYQVRPGKDFRPFTLYKFRTLKNGHTPDGRVLPDEARWTRVGNILRRTRLDELPQLWNVLKGDMSLIGPRPLLPRDLVGLGEAAAQKRCSVRPGITGWAQVNGGHQLTTNQKLALDLWYIRHYSPWLDVRIVSRTMRMMIFGEQVDERTLRRCGS